METLSVSIRLPIQHIQLRADDSDDHGDEEEDQDVLEVGRSVSRMNFALHTTRCTSAGTGTVKLGF